MVCRSHFSGGFELLLWVVKVQIKQFLSDLMLRLLLRQKPKHRSSCLKASRDCATREIMSSLVVYKYNSKYMAAVTTTIYKQFSDENSCPFCPLCLNSITLSDSSNAICIIILWAAACISGNVLMITDLTIYPGCPCTWN